MWALLLDQEIHTMNFEDLLAFWWSFKTIKHFFARKKTLPPCRYLFWILSNDDISDVRWKINQVNRCVFDFEVVHIYIKLIYLLTLIKIQIHGIAVQCAVVQSCRLHNSRYPSFWISHNIQSLGKGYRLWKFHAYICAFIAVST